MPDFYSNPKKNCNFTAHKIACFQFFTFIKDNQGVRKASFTDRSRSDI